MQWREKRESAVGKNSGTASCLYWNGIELKTQRRQWHLFNREIKKMLGHHYPVNTAGRKPPKLCAVFLACFFFSSVSKQRDLCLLPERRQINTLPTYPGGCEPLQEGRPLWHSTPPQPFPSVQAPSSCLCLCWVNRSSKSTFTYSCFQTVDGQCFCLWWSKMRFRVRTISNFNYSLGI